MSDNLDFGRPPAAETSATLPAAPNAAAPTMLVFDGVGSLADSLLGPSAAVAVPDLEAPEMAVPDLAAAPLDAEPPEVVTDEERTRYGLLLDRAAERGLLDPAEYEIRLRELAEATSTARMLEIVTELPAFSLPAPTNPRSPRSRRSVGTHQLAPGTGGQRRRNTVWVVLVVVVMIAVASLIVLALSVERLSRTHGSQSAPPVATQRFSGPRL